MTDQPLHEITQNYLERLNGLLAKTTPGPWDAIDDDGPWRVRCMHYADEEPGICSDHGKTWPLIEEDAQFIAAARSAVPALVAEVEGLRGKLASIREGKDGGR